MLEQMFERGIVISGYPVEGGAPEAVVQTSMMDLPDVIPAQTMPFPGCFVVVPPTCPVMVANPHDPIVVHGMPTQAAFAAAKALIASHPAIAGGGIMILDPLAATAGIIITPGEVDVIGLLKNNGVAPVP